MQKPVFTAVLLLCRLLSTPQVPSPSTPTLLADEYRPQLSLQASLNKTDSFRTGVLQGELRLAGRPVAGMKVVVEVGTAVRKEYVLADSLLSFSLAVPRVRTWTAETPYLYNVQVRLRDSGRRLEEVITQQVCFRQVELAGEYWRVNGRRVIMNGLDAPGGVVRSGMAAYVGLLKQFNVNAVRPQPGVDSGYWRSLCDAYGLYVLDRGPLFVGALVGPAAWEMKRGYQPVRTAAAGSGGMTLKVFNSYFFRDLSHLMLEWEVLLNGVAEQRGKAPLPVVGPQQTGVVRLPVKMPLRPGEVLVNIYYKLKKAEPGMPAGYVVASEQVLWRAALVNDVSVHPAGELVLKDEGGTFTIGAAATGLDMQFNKQTGWLQHYVVGGRSLLEDTLGLSANFWRPPTDYDYLLKLPVQLAAWKHATREPRLQLFSTSTSTDFVIVRADYLLPEVRCLLHIHYTVNARGEMQVEEILEVDSTQADTAGMARQAEGPMLPRMGMKWFLPAGFDSVTYYGRGPWENYQDRSDGLFAGVYRQTVDEQPFRYLRPQECGNRTDVRWWKITDRQGHGLMIQSDSSLLGISALHYFGDDLDDGDSASQRRMTDLVPRGQVQLNIDHRQMGVSGFRPYRLPYGNYHYIYKVSPL